MIRADARGYRALHEPGVIDPCGLWAPAGKDLRKGSGGSRRGPNAKIMAAIHPIPVGAPIKLTKNTSASRSTPRTIPINVGSMSGPRQSRLAAHDRP
jgi:hypothetical protein